MSMRVVPRGRRDGRSEREMATELGMALPRPRPEIHFAPAANWMNDAIGLIAWRDQYHLFYQYNPLGPVHGNICWGHAVSDDLVHWSDLPLALTPSPGWADEDGCWSGCSVVHEGEVYLLYTGLQGKRQRTCLAKACDDGLVRFEKVGDGPVIADEPLPGLAGFRDHTVWRRGDEFHQLMGSGTEALGGCLLEFRSTDLRHWDFVGVFMSAAATGLPGPMWECPDLFECGGRWFVVFSVFERHGHAGAWYVEGVFDGGRFQPLSRGRFDVGSRWYAPQSFSTPDGRRVVFGWLREHRDELPEGEQSRVGVMSLPRELFAGPGGQLGMAPVTELRSLRTRALVPAEPAVTGESRTLRASRPCQALEVEIAGAEGPISVELLGPGGDLVIGAVIDGDESEVSTVRRLPTASGAPRAGTPRTARLVYDGGICEIFDGAGQTRSEIFYSRPPVQSVAVRHLRGQADLGVTDQVRAWELKNIWNRPRDEQRSMTERLEAT
jgi:beta-fructofuranosidase